MGGGGINYVSGSLNRKKRAGKKKSHRYMNPFLRRPLIPTHASTRPTRLATPIDDEPQRDLFYPEDQDQGPEFAAPWDEEADEDWWAEEGFEYSWATAEGRNRLKREQRRAWFLKQSIFGGMGETTGISSEAAAEWRDRGAGVQGWVEGNGCRDVGREAWPGDREKARERQARIEALLSHGDLAGLQDTRPRFSRPSPRARPSLPTDQQQWPGPGDATLEIARLSQRMLRLNLFASNKYIGPLCPTPNTKKVGDTGESW